MKKYLISTGIAAIAFVSLAAAQNLYFANNMTVGSTGSDVVSLQNLLIQAGFHIPSVENGAAARGYFGSQTRAAVAAYQAANGIPNTGFVGPLTRARLNGGISNNPSLTVTSPNGGETWIKGTTQSIRWSGSFASLNQTGSIYLEYPTPSCALPSQPIRCMIAVRAPQLIIQGINLASGSYSWNVGDIQSLGCPGIGIYYENPNGVSYCKGDASDGQYLIRICNADSSICDSSNGAFTISTSGTSAQAPVINGVDAPTSLSVNQTGTWTVRATDPLNASLSYSVDWGDNACLSGYSCAPSANSIGQAGGSTQNSTFSHSYSASGTYKVTFTVTNLLGKAQTSSTVNVTGGSSAGPLQVISPNGGEVWTRGTTQTIRWTSPYYFRATYADIKLQRKVECTTQVCPMIAYAPVTIASNVPINQNSYNWNVGNAIGACNNSGTQAVMCGENFSVSDGQYTISICEVSSNNCDYSDSAFTINSNVSADNHPVINSISAPAVLDVNQTGTWSIQASNPINGNLNYAVDWGDQPYTYPVASNTGAGSQFSQNASFTHSYSQVGAYIVSFTAKNDAGLTAQTSATVKVGNCPPGTSLEIFNPKASYCLVTLPGSY